ncbi:MAG: putative signal transducing protein [Planctomycetota bacterium]|jgi:predicted Fe-Mo cluster-binding NifX family protein
MADKLVTIARFADYIQANLAKQLLADSGINSVVAGENAANAYAGLTAVAAAELQVLESQAQEALEILQSGKETETETELEQEQ